MEINNDRLLQEGSRVLVALCDTDEVITGTVKKLEVIYFLSGHGPFFPHVIIDVDGTDIMVPLRNISSVRKASP